MLMNKQKLQAYAVWLLPLLFFTYQFILRLWPGLNMQQIMSQFSISAGQFGVLSAYYYYGYAFMQIPVALLLDRFAANRVIFFFATVCAVAVLLFTYTHNWYLACLSRLLIGVGSAVGFLSVSKVIAQWFAAQEYAKMVGLSFSVGLLGAVYGGKPITLLINQYHWQSVATVLAIVALAIAVGNLLFLPKQNLTQPADQNRFSLRDFTAVFTTPAVWLLALGNFLMVGSLEGFADVWGVPYLMTTYQLDKATAAQLISCVYLGMLFGGPLLAQLSRRFGTYAVITGSGLFMALLFFPLLGASAYHGWLFASALFLIGILCCYQVIVFAAGSKLVKPASLGVTVALLNCVNMLGGSFFHTLIGKVMDSYWSGSVDSLGVRIYEQTAYHHALLIIPVCACVGASIVALLGVYQKRQTRLSSSDEVCVGA